MCRSVEIRLGCGEAPIIKVDGHPASVVESVPTTARTVADLLPAGYGAMDLCALLEANNSLVKEQGQRSGTR